MGIAELFILAIGLSMDAFAVAICKGLATFNLKKRHMILTGLRFGGFQALMPLIGYLIGHLFYEYIGAYGKYLTALIFFALGIKMIIDVIKEKKCEKE